MIQSPHKTNPGILYLSFNQDSSCFSVGTDNGFAISDSNPLKERFRRDFDDGGIKIVEMLFRCNIMALVGVEKHHRFHPNKVMIWDDSQTKCIAELEFRNPVKGVRLTRECIVVVLANKVYIYDIKNLKTKEELQTAENETGLCAVSSKDNQVIACLAEAPGHVKIYDVKTGDYKIFRAHKSPISQICMDQEGNKVATTSAKGTIIRVFDTNTKNMLWEFRRGSKEAAIQSLRFNLNGTILCLSSDRGTIHIYSCTSQDNAIENVSSSIIGFRSQVSFSVPEQHSICAFGPEEDGKNTLYVLGFSGRYYKYLFSNDAKHTLVSEELFV